MGRRAVVVQGWQIHYRILGGALVAGEWPAFMVARTALQADLHQYGLRPLNPGRDLGGVADLLEEVFKHELDAGGRQMIREARMLSQSGPLFFLLLPFAGGGLGMSPGYVWEQDGRIVGNVTMMRSKQSPDYWQIANVAVDPDHRRQGIATRLMETSLKAIQRKKGRLVSLQVRRDNPAVVLYQSFGFQPMGAVTRWQAETRFRLDQLLTQGRPLRRARADDWMAIWNLFKSAVPAAQGWPEPLEENDFRPGLWRWLADLFAGRSVQRWVAPASTGEIDGYAELRTEPGRAPQVTLRVRPAAFSQLEGDLLQGALSQLSRRGYGRVVIDHPAEDVAAEGRLREAGFRPLRTLLLMQLQLE